MNTTTKDIAKLINYTKTPTIKPTERIDWLQLNALANMQFPNNQPTRTNGPHYWQNPQDITCHNITVWMCSTTPCALPKTPSTQQKKQLNTNKIPFTLSTNWVLWVSLQHNNIPSTLFLDSCFSGSALEVTAEGGNFSAVIEVICRYIMWGLIQLNIILTSRPNKTTNQKQCAAQVLVHNVQDHDTILCTLDFHLSGTDNG